MSKTAAPVHAASAGGILDAPPPYTESAGPSDATPRPTRPRPTRSASTASSRSSTSSIHDPAANLLHSVPPGGHYTQLYPQQEAPSPAHPHAYAHARGPTPTSAPYASQPAMSAEEPSWKNPALTREQLEALEGKPGCCFSSSGACCFSDHGACCFSSNGACCFSDNGGCCFSDHGGCCCSDNGGAFCGDNEGCCFGNRQGACCGDDGGCCFGAGPGQGIPSGLQGWHAGAWKQRRQQRRR